MDKNTFCLDIEVGSKYSNIKLQNFFSAHVYHGVFRPKELSRKLVVLNLNWAHSSATLPYSPSPLAFSSHPPPPVLPQSLLLLLHSVLAGCQRTHRLLWTPTPAPCNDQTSSCSPPWNIYHTEGTYSVSVGREAGTKVEHERQREY